MIRLLNYIPTRDKEDISSDHPGDVPKEFDIFYRTEAAFIPAGKTFEELTPAEQEKVKSQYRFDPLRPGLYQSITGYGNMI